LKKTVSEKLAGGRSVIQKLSDEKTVLDKKIDELEKKIEELECEITNLTVKTHESTGESNSTNIETSRDLRHGGGTYQGSWKEDVTIKAHSGPLVKKLLFKGLIRSHKKKMLKK